MNKILKSNDFTVEMKLLLLSGKLTICEEEQIAIRKILESQTVNWFEFIKYALYHKIVQICWNNIKKIYPSCNMPKYLYESITYLYKCTEMRNKCYQEELHRLQEKFSENGILCIPVKGIYLIDNIYTDYGIRYLGDMDFLVRYEDIKILKKILGEMGYICGKYSYDLNQIFPISREEEIKWKLYMSNLAPFDKLSNNELFPFYKLDFRYALDDSLNKEPVREIINATYRNGKTSYAHYFVHLCTHFFDEAQHVATIASAKDINMIKLCDIREYALKFMSTSEFKSVLEFAEKYNLEKAIYYSLYYLKEVYADGYESKVMELFHISDYSFLNSFGDSTLNNEQQFKKGFWNRFFACGNEDELLEKPKFFR